MLAVTALASAAFLAFIGIIEVTAGAATIAAPIAGMPFFLLVLVIGLGMAGYFGGLGATVMVVLGVGAWLAAFLVGTGAVEVARHGYTGTPPLEPAEYTLGAAGIGLMLPAAFYALMMILGRRLASPAALRVATIHTILLGAVGAGLGLLFAAIRGAHESAVWLGVPFILVWLWILANGAYGVAGGVSSPLTGGPATRALMADLQARRDAGQVSSAAWVTALAGLTVVGVAALFVLQLITADRYTPASRFTPSGAMPAVTATPGGSSGKP
jgi:hypothetical protein